MSLLVPPCGQWSLGQESIRGTRPPVRCPPVSLQDVSPEARSIQDTASAVTPACPQPDYTNPPASPLPTVTSLPPRATGFNVGLSSGYLMTLDTHRVKKKTRGASERRRKRKWQMDTSFKMNGFRWEDRKGQSEKLFIVRMNFSQTCQILLQELE